MNIEMTWDDYMYGVRIKIKTSKYDLLCMSGHVKLSFFTLRTGDIF